MDKQQTPKERPEVSAARQKLAAAQVAYDQLLKQTKVPTKSEAEAKALNQKLKTALAAKRTAAADLESALANRPAPKQLAETQASSRKTQDAD